MNLLVPHFEARNIVNNCIGFVTGSKRLFDSWESMLFPKQGPNPDLLSTDFSFFSLSDGPFFSTPLPIYKEEFLGLMWLVWEKLQEVIDFGPNQDWQIMFRLVPSLEDRKSSLLGSITELTPARFRDEPEIRSIFHQADMIDEFSYCLTCLGRVHSYLEGLQMAINEAEISIKRIFVFEPKKSLMTYLPDSRTCEIKPNTFEANLCEFVCRRYALGQLVEFTDIYDRLYADGDYSPKQHKDKIEKVCRRLNDTVFQAFNFRILMPVPKANQVYFKIWSKE